PALVACQNLSLSSGGDAGNERGTASVGGGDLLDLRRSGLLIGVLDRQRDPPHPLIALDMCVCGGGTDMDAVPGPDRGAVDTELDRLRCRNSSIRTGQGPSSGP